METKIFKEPDGTIRSATSLELIGYWFDVDNVTYFGYKKDFDSLKHD